MMAFQRLFHRAAPAFWLLIFAACVNAGDWPGWRGPTGVGYTDEKDLPLTWDGKTGENVLWKASIKGTTGYSSAIVSGQRVFITTAARQTGEQETNKEIPAHSISCYQAKDGTLLWRTEVAPGKESAGYAIYAVPTPVTDGKAVYAWFGSAVVAAVDFDGKLLWREERNGPFKLNPGICSSPVIYQETLLLLCDQGGGNGWLQALDRSTGKVRWEQKRGKSSYGNTSPILLPVAGKTQLIIQASEMLQGLDPANGEPIWWCKGRGFGASPAFGSGLIFSDSGNGESGVVVDPTGSGDVSKSHIKWQAPKIRSQYGSAVVSGDYVYRASDKGIIYCWKLASGEEMFAADAPGVSKLSSPFATADGRIYFANGDKSYVLQSGPEFKVLATNDLRGGDNGSSAAVSNGKIFIRGGETLFCVGKK